MYWFSWNWCILFDSVCLILENLNSKHSASDICVCVCCARVCVCVWYKCIYVCSNRFFEINMKEWNVRPFDIINFKELQEIKEEYLCVNKYIKCLNLQKASLRFALILFVTMFWICVTYTLVIRKNIPLIHWIQLLVVSVYFNYLRKYFFNHLVLYIYLILF